MKTTDVETRHVHRRICTVHCTTWCNNRYNIHND